MTTDLASDADIKTEILWVNHASFVIRHGGVCLMMDPWFNGAAFDNGWRLVSPTVFQAADFTQVTHLGFTSDRSDRFHLPTLLSIPESHRWRINTLLPATMSHRCASTLRELNFRQTHELLSHEWFELAPGFSFLSVADGNGHTWSCVKVGGLTILNLSSVEIEKKSTLMAIQKIIGQPDVLLAPFTYVNLGTPANGSDSKMVSGAVGRRRMGDDKLRALKMQFEILQPQFILPTGGYFRFCHEENYFCNDEINTPDKIQLFLQKLGAQPVILYPGDVWSIGEAHDTALSVQHYLTDWRLARSSAVLETAARVEANELQKFSREYIARLQSKNNSALLSWFLKEAVPLYISDLKKFFSLSYPYGLTPRSSCEAAVELSSAALSHLLRFENGGETLLANGRLLAPKAANFAALVRFIEIGRINHRGGSFALPYFAKSRFLNALNWFRPPGHPWAQGELGV